MVQLILWLVCLCVSVCIMLLCCGSVSKRIKVSGVRVTTEVSYFILNVDLDKSTERETFRAPRKWNVWHENFWHWPHHSRPSEQLLSSCYNSHCNVFLISAAPVGWQARKTVSLLLTIERMLNRMSRLHNIFHHLLIRYVSFLCNAHVHIF